MRTDHPSISKIRNRLDLHLKRSPHFLKRPSASGELADETFLEVKDNDDV